jgi:hypothetical protein
VGSGTLPVQTQLFKKKTIVMNISVCTVVGLLLSYRSLEDIPLSFRPSKKGTRVNLKTIFLKT